MEQAMAKLGAEVLDDILTAAMTDPDAMRKFANDISPPAEPVQDYLTEVETRRALFDEFRVICQQYGARAHATAMAVFLVAPVSGIRTQLEVIRNMEQNRLTMVSGILTVAPHAIRTYIPRRRSADAPDYPPAAVPSPILNEPGMYVLSSSVTRNGFAGQVKDRDGHTCGFSGMSDPQAARIFPFSTSESKVFGYLNELLTSFWGSEKAMAWRRHFEAAGITQSAKNGISMNHQIHFWFDNARFALKPLRETAEGIVIQWHWLKGSILKPNTYIRPDSDILHQAGVMDQHWGDTLAHRESGVRIRTGQTFVLRRHEHMPSWELLEMHIYDFEDPDERGFDEAVAAKQRAILAEYEKVKGKAEVVDRSKGKGVDREEAGGEDTGE
ncbi:hypothetical protein OQA88_6981 [Cercophora sp. LCS_1]